MVGLQTFCITMVSIVRLTLRMPSGSKTFDVCCASVFVCLFVYRPRFFEQ